MIPIEYLWYIIGAVSVPVFIWFTAKALRRNREDKARVAMRRKRFERTMKSSNRVNSEFRFGKSPPVRKTNTGEVPTTADEHWLNGVKLPPKRERSETTGHWLEHVKPKRKHWLDNLRRK